MNSRCYIPSVLLLALSVCSIVYPATRYVSHTGSNTSPYTTWETAANTIEAANIATIPGDTIFIDTGSFYVSTIVYTQPRITLCGKGIDSTHILPSQPLGSLFLPEDSTVVYDLHFDGLYNVSTQLGTDYAFAKFATDPWRTFVCHRCKFSRFKFTPISFSKMIYVEIKNCWFETWEGYALSLTERGDYVIENNTFDADGHALSFFDFMFAIGKKCIRKNIFLGGGQGGIEGGTAGRMEMTNNLFYGNLYLPTALSVGEHEFLLANNSFFISHLYPGPHTNPTVMIYGDQWSRDFRIYNNIFVDYEPHILFRYAYPAGAEVRVTHNCFFATSPEAENDFLWADGGAVLPDSVYANLLLDPMLVDPQNGDLHLQAGSPCIDAGAPWILDVDGTRSDMGAFGGAGGSVYAYVDYPPQTPSQFTAWRDGSRVVLSWYRNTESDLSFYVLVRSRSSPVSLDSTSVLTYLTVDGKPIGEKQPTKHLWPVGEADIHTGRPIHDEFIPLNGSRAAASIFYTDKSVPSQEDYYYALVAVDSSLLVSACTEEQYVPAATSIVESDPDSSLIPVIAQNYPNPFNATTAIVYSLPNIGAQPAPVELNVYNMLGQLVKRIVNERQYAGKHTAYWDGTDASGQPVASGVYLYQLRASGIDLIENRKMILMK